MADFFARALLALLLLIAGGCLIAALTVGMVIDWVRERRARHD